jgi:SAM-dependent methyltransferase
MPIGPGFGPVRKVYAVDGSRADEPEYWDDVSSGTDIATYVAREQHERPGGIRELTALMPPKGRVLEAGCGGGGKLALLAAEGFDAYGLDFALGMLTDMVRQLPTIRAVGADLACMPFAPGSFDCVLSFGTLEHFEDGPQGPLAEHRRILRTGGTLIIIMPRISALKQWNDWLSIGLRRRSSYLSGRGRVVRRVAAPAREDVDVGSFVQYEFSRRWFLRYLREAGFTPVKASSNGNAVGIGESRLARRLSAHNHTARDRTTPETTAAPLPAAATNGGTSRPPASLPRRAVGAAKEIVLGEHADAPWQRPLVRLSQAGLGHLDLVVATAN